MRARRQTERKRFRLVRGGASLATLALLLFIWNGLDPGWRKPEYEELATPALSRPIDLRVLAFNIAKASFHHGGLDFADSNEVREHLDRIAELIRQSEAHLVFLSEVVWESGPVPVNQVRYLAGRTGMHALAYGDNYRFGWPFLRIRSGNAILSKLPLRALSVEALSGGGSLFDPTGVRRVLWCELELEDGALRLGSVRNDSFDLESNRVQAAELLDMLGERPALLVGDFNAEPEDASMRLFRDSGRWSGAAPDQPTYPAHAPVRQIDYVLAPSEWERRSQLVLESTVSDHLPVLAVLRRLR